MICDAPETLKDYGPVALLVVAALILFGRRPGDTDLHNALCDAKDMHLEWRGALAPGHVLLLGELHGTQQSPQLAGIAVCDALRAGRSVALFLEWPTPLFSGDRRSSRTWPTRGHLARNSPEFDRK